VQASVDIHLVFKLDIEVFEDKDFLCLQEELCHVLFTADVLFTETAEQASTPPSGLTELPTCPVCLGNSEVVLPVQHPLTVPFIDFVLKFF